MAEGDCRLQSQAIANSAPNWRNRIPDAVLRLLLGLFF
jgi:hypothetical protein